MEEEEMSWKLPLFRIYWDEADVKAATSVVRRGSYWAEGPEIALFEAEVAKYSGREHAVAFGNGTAALHAMMIAYGIGPGDEVIVPSFTFISTANAPLFVGAKPVFAEIEPETYGLDPRKMKKKITKRTKAIIPVHYAGQPCDMDAIHALADPADIDRKSVV
jgi:perosamine synthetase